MEAECSFFHIEQLQEIGLLLLPAQSFESMSVETISGFSIDSTGHGITLQTAYIAKALIISLYLKIIPWAFLCDYFLQMLSFYPRNHLTK